MAYLTLLASVSEEQTILLRRGEIKTCKPHLVVSCSHLLTSWVRPARLRELLRSAIDGGTVLRQDLWHPFRVPLWLDPGEVARLDLKLSAEWQTLIQEHGKPSTTDWYAIEISKVLQIFGHASAKGEGIVSLLCPPLDKKRAHRVEIPLEEKSLSESTFQVSTFCAKTSMATVTCPSLTLPFPYVSF
jgi:hypothetical protein